MKKIVLEVEELDSSNFEHTTHYASNYPSDGVFVLSTDIFNLYFVSKMQNAVYIIPLNMIPSPIMKVKEENKQSDESLLLKAIAIVRQPDLAIQLIKEG